MRLLFSAPLKYSVTALNEETKRMVEEGNYFKVS